MTSKQLFLIVMTIGFFTSIAVFPHIASATESQAVYTFSGNIWKINIDGTGNTQLSTDNASAWGSMTSDFTKVIYANYGAANPNGNIYIMNANGTNPTNLTNATDDGEGAPAVSANGTKIVYMRSDSGNKDIYIMNINGTGQTRLTTDPAEDDWAAISPDATKIAFTSARDNSNGGIYQIFIMNADGTDQTELTSGSGVNEYPAFSPDGTKIAFEKNGVIYTMNLDGSNQTSIKNNGTPVQGSFPTYNAAGTKILYADGNTGNITVMNADGSSPVTVSTQGNYPHFSLFQPIALDTTPPAFTASSTASAVTSTGATIAWTTDEPASTKVTYGLTSSYGTSTPTTDVSPATTTHSVALSGLLPCTSYHYAAVTTDASLNTATSSDAVLTTACAGGATPSVATSTTVTVSSPATSTVSNAGRTFTVATPANFTATSSSVVIQIKGLDSTAVLGSIGKPSTSLTSAASVVFDVTALINNTTILDSFNAPVTISYTYTDADIAGLDESSLSMYHYHDGTWLPLNNCSVNTSSNTITCNAPSFSTFAIFGTPAVVVSNNSSGGSSGGLSQFSSGSVATVASPVTPMVPTPSVAVNQIGAGYCPYYHFTRQLRFGDKGEDVRALQKFLNCAGFSLGASGPGSPGNETPHFSDRTLNSVNDYQRAYGADILVPINAASPTGIFAVYSQKKAYSLMYAQ